MFQLCTASSYNARKQRKHFRKALFYPDKRFIVFRLRALRVICVLLSVTNYYHNWLPQSPQYSFIKKYWFGGITQLKMKDEAGLSTASQWPRCTIQDVRPVLNALLFLITLTLVFLLSLFQNFIPLYSEHRSLPRYVHTFAPQLNSHLSFAMNDAFSKEKLYV